jgi:general stress protein 26
MTMTDERQKLEKIFGHFDNAMLVTTGQDDMIHARPMRIVERADDFELWFLTSRRSGKVDELQGDLRAAVIVQGDGEYACLSGMASATDDRDTRHRLWSAFMTPWFPDGPDSPDLVAIRFVPSEGTYWDASGIEGVKYLLRAVKAVVKGERLEDRDDSPERRGSVTM